ncbi:hypothetical protein ACVQH5_29305, partial [Klebsiella pneumoniae]
ARRGIATDIHLTGGGVWTNSWGRGAIIFGAGDNVFHNVNTGGSWQKLNNTQGVYIPPGSAIHASNPSQFHGIAVAT